jgi:hypothetical protein
MIEGLLLLLTTNDLTSFLKKTYLREAGKNDAQKAPRLKTYKSHLAKKLLAIYKYEPYSPCMVAKLYAQSTNKLQPPALVVQALFLFFRRVA